MDASDRFLDREGSRLGAIAGDLWVGGVALFARLAVILWAGGRFPPAADGFYYHAIGARVAAGLGSTWPWPDGTVTYAAHYPIGYPALLAIAYRVGGVGPSAAGVLNAVIGAGAAVAAYRLTRQAAGPWVSRAAGFAVALHPALVMYTPALMTEGVTAALVAVAAWLCSRRSNRALLGLGLMLGVATLVRPQSLVLAPIFGFLSCDPGSRWKRRCGRGAVALLVAVAVCLPWTARNCVRMHRCALVSFNGGWNLLIGAGPNAAGTWAPVDVPEPCRTVWDEAQKDACFGREARRMIAEAPRRWLRLVPDRLAATFDYGGAPGYYLHASNPGAFDDHAKTLLGAVETLYERLAWIGALAAAALATGPARRARVIVAGISIALTFQLHVYLAVLGLVITLALLGKALIEGPVVHSATLTVLAATALVHAVFFGSGRYSMVAYPLLTALAFAFPRRRGDVETPGG
jgi:4-amino-4-deoxy-L-arabinose transferase-like glycosyltransferase